MIGAVGVGSFIGCPSWGVMVEDEEGPDEAKAR